MNRRIHKVSKNGTNGEVTIPAKEVEVIIRPIHSTNPKDQKVLTSANKILKTYKQDFKNL